MTDPVRESLGCYVRRLFNSFAWIIYRIRLKPGQTVTHDLKPGRCAWLQIARGGA
jgi:hypothetical protein